MREVSPDRVFAAFRHEGGEHEGGEHTKKRKRIENVGFEHAPYSIRFRRVDAFDSFSSVASHATSRECVFLVIRFPLCSNFSIRDKKERNGIFHMVAIQYHATR